MGKQASGSAAEGLATDCLNSSWYHNSRSQVWVFYSGVSYTLVPVGELAAGQADQESQGVWGIGGNGKKMTAPHNDAMEGRYISFSLLIVPFLRVSSPETLSSLSFHNEINSFSFVFTKVVVSSKFRVPAVSCRGYCVTMMVVVLWWTWLFSPPGL